MRRTFGLLVLALMGFSSLADGNFTVARDGLFLRTLRKSASTSGVDVYQIQVPAGQKATVSFWERARSWSEDCNGLVVSAEMSGGAGERLADDPAARVWTVTRPSILAVSVFPVVLSRPDVRGMDSSDVSRSAAAAQQMMLARFGALDYAVNVIYEPVVPETCDDGMNWPDGGAMASLVPSASAFCVSGNHYCKVMRGTGLVGLLRLTIRKRGNGTSRVSAQLTTVEGKKYSAPPVVLENSSTKRVLAAFEVKEYGTLRLAMGNGVFAGTLGQDCQVQSCRAGGAFAAAAPLFRLQDPIFKVRGAEVNQELLPLEVQLSTAGGRLSAGAAASIAYARGVWTGADNPDRPNLSGLKFSYNSGTGRLTGSFKAYAVSERGRLVRATVTLRGFVIDGEGFMAVACRGSDANGNSATVR